MRYLRLLLGIVLAISLLLNVVLTYKLRGKRALITVNGTPITRNDMYSYMEQEFGPQYKANMVQRILVDQEAHALGVAPTDEDIQAEYDTKRELDWSYAQKLARSPWLVEEAKAEIKLQYETQRLLTKDIIVTDEEVREELQANAQIYDTPNKAHCSVAAVMNEARTEDIRRLLVSLNPPYSPAKIMSDYPQDVVFLGDNNRFTFAQPFGSDYNSQIFKMEPKSVQVEPPGELSQLGAKKILIRLDDLEPGHRADPSDPKVIKNIKLHVALKRSRPPGELLASLWAKANVVFEDHTDRVNTEMIFFPDRARTKSK
jgi:hypothetical protein